eukprot:m.29745 g.29745  ORF g.29745 m.29745 type:complete len:349 (-) comp16153_c0_seq1:184-1230(-)
MRETQLSTSERTFVNECLAQRTRVDCRAMFDYRKVSISFGEELGHSEVSIGGTKAIAQTSCEIVVPSPNRPSEGTIRYNVELSPMAAPSFDVGRPSPKAIEIQRIVERVLKDSRAVETESLCIVSGEKVWAVRVDIHIVDHCGNMADAAALAALASIIHFRRPHVTVIGEDVTIHAIKDHVPDPLSVHHRPVCVTFGFFGEGEVMVVDPGLKEEAVSVGFTTMALNSHKEVCAVHKLGGVALSADQLFECMQVAHVKALELSTILTAAVKKDEAKRKSDTDVRGPSLRDIKKIKITKTTEDVTETDLVQAANVEPLVVPADTKKSEATVVATGPKTAELFAGQQSSWK